MNRRAAPAAALILAAGFALAACAPPAATPTAWQSTVQTVAQQASTGDYASALATLDALEAEVTARRDAGEISGEEADGILSRIATVRADLTSLVPAPATTPTPALTEVPVESSEPAPEEQGDDGQDTVTDDGTENPGQDAPDTGSTGDDPTEEGPVDKGSSHNGRGQKNDDKAPGGKGSSGTGKKDG